MLKELDVMKLLQPHPNIIPLMGCCTTSDPICLIKEYAANGNLQDLLRSQRSTFEMNDLNSSDAPQRFNLKVRDLTIFGLHVAAGMEYISSQKVSQLLLSVACVTLGYRHRLALPCTH